MDFTHVQVDISLVKNSITIQKISAIGIYTKIIGVAKLDIDI